MCAPTTSASTPNLSSPVISMPLTTTHFVGKSGSNECCYKNKVELIHKKKRKHYLCICLVLTSKVSACTCFELKWNQDAPPSQGEASPASWLFREPTDIDMMGDEEGEGDRVVIIRF